MSHVYYQQYLYFELNVKVVIMQKDFLIYTLKYTFGIFGVFIIDPLTCQQHFNAVVGGHGVNFH